VTLPASRGGADAVVGKRLLALSDAMFHEWHAFKRMQLDADEFARRMAPIQADWKQAAASLASGGGKESKALGASMLRMWRALWNLAEYEGVVPPNNDAEREIRRQVKIKKATYGSTSEHGAHMVATS
jgi:hypothetical protein